MRLGFLRVQHGRDSAEDDRHTAAAILVGNVPAALHLAAEHHGNADEIDGVVVAQRLDVFVNEIHVHVFW